MQVRHEVAKEPHFGNSIHYDVLNDDKAYRIIFTLPNYFEAEVYCYLNRLERKVIVVVRPKWHRLKRTIPVRLCGTGRCKFR